MFGFGKKKKKIEQGIESKELEIMEIIFLTTVLVLVLLFRLQGHI